MSRQLTTEIFIQRANEVHGDRYDYRLVNYTSWDKKVTIICREHGEFQQLARGHLSGRNCFKCGRIDGGHNRIMTNELFIEKATKLHGNRYDYSKTEYTGNRKKVIIICKEHGEFLQKPNIHLLGHNCKKCGLVEMGKKGKLGKDRFISKAIEVHGNKYCYDNVEYVTSSHKVTITCKEHGDFDQTPNSHLRGTGCIKCGSKKISDAIRKDKDYFIDKAKKHHGNRYDYSLVEYTGVNSKVTIICSKHGPFKQIAQVHASGHGCSKCGEDTCKDTRTKKSLSNAAEFIEKVEKLFSGKYDYSKVNYINSHVKVTIICKVHGEFFKSPYNHLSGKGCKVCAFEKRSKNKSSNTETFIEKAKKIHKDTYDYSKVEYVSACDKVIIICKVHGEFKQIPYCHLNGHGCRSCINKTEGIFNNEIKKIYPTLVKEYRQEWCRNKRFDFCIPEEKIIIELDGGQHFKQVRNWKPPEHQFANDKYKEKCANENKYSMIRILQQDVLKDAYDWVKEVCDAIEELKRDKQVRNIYLCKKDEYAKYKLPYVPSEPNNATQIVELTA